MDGELVALEQEVARLRSEASRLRTRGAPAEALREWAVVRDLVDRRAFSWSELLGHLEEVVPADVRLLSITPVGSEGQIEVNVRAVGRTVEDGLELLQALQDREEFREPFLTSVGDTSQGIDLSYTMSYVPALPASGGER